MAELEFTWSPAKAATNKRKHRVSFGEAQTVFYDDEALLLDDPDHSETEDRFVLLGLSASLRVLLVVRRPRRQYQDHFRSQGHSRRAFGVRQTEEQMRKEYDFSKARKNPYAKRLKKSITIRLDEPTVQYFRHLAEEAQLPYQSLINLYLRDCAVSNRRPSLVWKESRKGAA
jgi:uncharacterized DUF497 family protein